MNYKFKEKYWGADKSTRGTFLTRDQLEDYSDELMSGSTVFAYTEEKKSILKVRVNGANRGLEFPGGHRDGDETGEECAIREVYEEAAVRITNVKRVGVYLMEKLIENDKNKKYSPRAYISYYIAEIASLDDFISNEEIAARELIEINSIVSDPNGVNEVTRYMIDQIRAEG